jgi:hypothetical protein
LHGSKVNTASGVLRKAARSGFLRAAAGVAQERDSTNFTVEFSVRQFSLFLQAAMLPESRMFSFILSKCRDL